MQKSVRVTSALSVARFHHWLEATLPWDTFPEALDNLGSQLAEQRLHCVNATIRKITSDAIVLALLLRFEPPPKPTSNNNSTKAS
jgi:hypothetical protein